MISQPSFMTPASTRFCPSRCRHASCPLRARPHKPTIAGRRRTDADSCGLGDARGTPLAADRTSTTGRTSRTANNQNRWPRPDACEPQCEAGAFCSCRARSCSFLIRHGVQHRAMAMATAPPFDPTRGSQPEILTRPPPTMGRKKMAENGGFFPRAKSIFPCLEPGLLNTSH